MDVRKKSTRKKHRRKKYRKKKETKKIGTDLLLSFIITIVLFVFGSSFFWTVNRVEGYGMVPTIRDKDVVIVRKTTEIKRFDLVLMHNTGKNSVRRVIGLPGEDIAYENDTLYVNHSPVDEKFIFDEVNNRQLDGSFYTNDFSQYAMSGQLEIPKNKFLVLGDNRPYAVDSRSYGLIDRRDIIGIVRLRILPLDQIKFF